MTPDTDAAILSQVRDAVRAIGPLETWTLDGVHLAIWAAATRAALERAAGVCDLMADNDADIDMLATYHERACAAAIRALKGEV